MRLPLTSVAAPVAPALAPAVVQDPSPASEAAAREAVAAAGRAAEAAQQAGEAAAQAAVAQAARAARGEPAQSEPAQAIASTGAPRTIADVRGLRARRDMLRDQLERASNRRDEVLREMRDATADAKPGLEARLKLLDERILQLEREQAATEQALGSTEPALLAQEASEARESFTEQARINGYMDEDEAVGMMFGGFGAGMVLVLAAGRVRGWWRRRRARRSGLPTATDTMPAVAARDPRIDQLTQAVDSIALEVERISEGQRFVTQLLANPGQRPEPQPAARREPRDATTRETATTSR